MLTIGVAEALPAQNAGVVRGRTAPLVHGCQEPRLLHDTYLAGGTVHFKRARSHRQVLAERFGLAMQVQHSDRPEKTIERKIFGAEIEKGHLVAQRGLHVSNQCQHVRDSYLGNVCRVQTALFEATGSLDHPEMLAQFATLQVDLELLCPESEEV